MNRTCMLPSQREWIMEIAAENEKRAAAIRKAATPPPRLRPKLEIEAGAIVVSTEDHPFETKTPFIVLRRTEKTATLYHPKAGVTRGLLEKMRIVKRAKARIWDHVVLAKDGLPGVISGIDHGEARRPFQIQLEDEFGQMWWCKRDDFAIWYSPQLNVDGVPMEQEFYEDAKA